MPDENLNQDLSLDDIFSRIRKEVKDTGEKTHAPFKFLDSYTRDDWSIFFGRESETEEIFRKLYSGRFLLVYGKSGTGKSSIVNCGLISRVPQEDIYAINIRCGNKAFSNFIAEISKHSDIKKNNPIDILEDIFYEKSKPVVLIFDQFEEVFLFSDDEEKLNLGTSLNNILKSRLKINVILVIREEYFANLTDFEPFLPRLYDNRVRIETMKRASAKEAIVRPCKACNTGIEDGLADKIIEQLTGQTPGVELTWLQILMDKLYRTACERDSENPLIKHEDLDSLGMIGNVLGNFLEEQLRSMPHGDLGEVVLKGMISSDGTKKQVNLKEISDAAASSGHTPDQNLLEEILRYLINVRIITEKDDQGYFELRHDALAGRIFEKMTGTERAMIEVKTFLDSSYKIYLQRGVLLTENDLKYISFYENKAVHKNEIKEFIRTSKKEILKTRQRKRNIVVSVAVVLILIMSCFTVWALSERRKAQEQTVIAESQKKEAENSRMLAMEGEQKAREKEALAVEQQRIAEEQRKTAVRANLEAENSKKQALEERNRAVENEVLALTSRQQAENARNEVIKASRQARFYLYLFNGKSLANKSLAMQDNPSLRTLLALSGYDLVKYGYENYSDDNALLKYDPEILKSLQNSYFLFGTDSLASGEIWNISSKKQKTVFSTEIGQITLSKLENVDAKKLPVLKAAGSFTLQTKSIVRALSFDLSSPRLACGTLDGNVILFDDPDSAQTNQRIIYNQNKRILHLVFVPGKDWLISSSSDRTLLVWDLGRQTIVKQLITNNPVQKFVLIDPDHLLFIDNAVELRVWHLDDLNREPQIVYSNRHSQPFGTMAFNDELNCLVTSVSGTIMVFQVLGAEKLKDLKPTQLPIKHKTVVSHLEFSPDNKWLASGSTDAIMLWDLSDFDFNDPDKLGPLSIENNRQLFSVGFDSESKYLFYGDNRVLHICPVDINEIYAKLKLIMGKKTLSEKEWKYYVKGDLEKPVTR
jgi:WD40 repeat protein